uniref:WD repeat-containing protein 89 n=1 Tax=Timema douglasi TaxID=61478 RepID=A0A7R8VIB1_TIMDO|nr:unnamed protein product [Timema douglasi]
MQRPDRESNLDLPVIGSLVCGESEALDHAATEADDTDGTGQPKPLRSFDIACNDRFVSAGTELVDGDAFLLFWDARSSKLLGGYWESHREEITQQCFSGDVLLRSPLQAHPMYPRFLLHQHRLSFSVCYPQIIVYTGEAITTTFTITFTVGFAIIKVKADTLGQVVMWLALVRFHPSKCDTVTTGSTDGLINIFDLSQGCEDDALLYSLNTEASVETLGWVTNDGAEDGLSCITQTEELQMWSIDGAAPDVHFTREDITKHIQRKSVEDCYLVNLHQNTSSRELFLIAGTTAQGGECLRTLSVKNNTLKPLSQFLENKQIVRTSWYDENNGILVTGGESGLISLWKHSKSTLESSSSDRKMSSKLWTSKDGSREDFKKINGYEACREEAGGTDSKCARRAECKRMQEE